MVSTNNKWIQLCDFVSGIIAALLAFVNENDISAMKLIIESFDETQKSNLKMLMGLMRKSSNRNKYFDHMSCNFEQGERSTYLLSCYDSI